ncbi:hypothetical protein GCM10017044_22580 [Kordiimonas sediminis]|uniref:Strictosidine synthase conserved region domain-containing protein n=1 Tax=Kordiimonas sediminis TaxID=1735581 RepID=A0A919AWL9_9PROT|nr:SMP-30/gluconolactonase/LRE family protein [Kordiimonas sediminis]GHF27024.1 hypothetical protein GCM10017044_22580 [Kordiimonas sediminis]
MFKFIKVLAGLLVLLVLVLVVSPSVINPVKTERAKSSSYVGVYAENTELRNAQVISLKSGTGPEDVAVDSQGRIYGGLHDGRIVRILSDGQQETFADTGGRPLGLHFDRENNLIVADAWKGLLSINPAGEITVLTTEANGVPFAFTDDLDIASDGVIYFSDASDVYNQPDYALDLLEGRPHGRLLSYDPKTEKTTVLLDDLYFANGIAVSSDDSFVLVNETWKYRVTRYWLTGDKAGTSEIFIDGLPGYPDGISANEKDVFWVAIASPPNPLVDSLGEKPFIRSLLAKLPAFLRPGAIRQGTVVGLDRDGKVLTTLHDPKGEKVYMVTSVEQVGDKLYLGSLEAPQIGIVTSPY